MSTFISDRSPTRSRSCLGIDISCRDLIAGDQNSATLRWSHGTPEHQSQPGMMLTIPVEMGYTIRTRIASLFGLRLPVALWRALLILGAVWRTLINLICSPTTSKRLTTVRYMPASEITTRRGLATC